MPRAGTPRKPGVEPRYASHAAVDELLQPVTRLTNKQIKFIELVGAGVPHQEAGAQSGLRSSGSRYRCLTTPVAIQYLSSLRAESRAIAAYDIASAMQEAKEARDFAIKHENPMAVVKATELRAKLSGLLIDRVEVVTVDLRGSLEQAEKRVLNVMPTCTQVTQAQPQAELNNVG
jgi:hypothetical protein